MSHLSFLFLGISSAALGQSDPRIARLSADPQTIDEGEVISFEAEASHPDGSLLNYDWSFGDGSRSRLGINLDAQSHRFRKSGHFTLSLRVEDPEGRSASQTLEVTVNNVAPDIQRINRSPVAGQLRTLSFRALVIEPGDDELTFTWTFGTATPSPGRTNETSSTATPRKAPTLSC